MSAPHTLIFPSDGRGHGREGLNDPFEVISAIAELDENTLVLLRDFHLFLEDGNPMLIRAIKDALLQAKTQSKVLIILGCRQVLLPEIERELCLLHFSLPDKEQLTPVLANICESANRPVPDGDEREQILDAATGMTCIEAENAFALSVIEREQVVSGVVPVKMHGSLRPKRSRTGTRTDFQSSTPIPPSGSSHRSPLTRSWGRAFAIP